MASVKGGTLKPTAIDQLLSDDECNAVILDWCVVRPARPDRPPSDKGSRVTQANSPVNSMIWSTAPCSTRKVFPLLRCRTCSHRPNEIAASGNMSSILIFPQLRVW